MKNILDAWPHADKVMRERQKESLQWLSEQSAKYLILQAPVGSGKSLVGMTYSRHLSSSGKGNAFLLTPQRILQQQYMDTFKEDHTHALYGKQNYSCDCKGTTCDIGSMIKPKCTSCPYTAAFGTALTAPNLVMNYKLALLLFHYHPKYNSGDVKRDLMVLDECHTLESHLVDFDVIAINRRFVETRLNMKWPFIKEMPDCIEWVKTQYFDKLQVYHRDIEDEVRVILMKQSKLTQTEVRKLSHYNSINDHLGEIEFLIFTPLENVMADRVMISDSISYQFKVLFGRDNFSLISDKAERFLFMSGTVDRFGFCRDIGIDPDQAAFFSVDSEIPVDNRPIHFIPTMKVNATWNAPDREKDRATLIATIKSIIDMHEEDSGVIHSGNFKLAEWLVDELKEYAEVNDITILHHNPNPDEKVDRNQTIEDYITIAGVTKKRALLISPSVNEGLDLADDLGRYSITVKVPFGNLGDAWTKTRMNLSNEWYRRQAVYNVLQASGRVVRSNTDHGSTYILDESWQRLMNDSLSLIPQWWRDAYNK